jgi:GNAT superfamily N-acetyltransferase
VPNDAASTGPAATSAAASDTVAAAPLAEGVRLRDAGPDDVEAVWELILALADYEQLRHEVVGSVELLREHLVGPDAVARAVLAEVDGADANGDTATVVAGFALWYPTFSTFLTRPGIWLEDLFVRPEHRGLGLGKALLAHLRARTDGRVEWAVLDWNAPSIAFYDALGARPVSDWIRYRWDSSAG